LQAAAAGAAQVGAQTGAGAQQVGAAGAQQVGAGAQQLGLQHLVRQHDVRWHRERQQLNLGMWKQQDFLQQPELPQHEAAGAAHVGAQTGAGAQQVGAGAQQLGAGAQQLFWQQLRERQQPPKLNAFASVALAQQNSKAAINVVHFIIVISWNGVSNFWD
jgi:hypothetical protein